VKTLIAVLTTALSLINAGWASLTTPVSEVKMLAFGDLMLARDVRKFMETDAVDYPFREIFGPNGLDPFSYDIVSANLEGTIFETAKRADLFPQFAFDPAVAPQVLKDFGFNLLNLANNHTWDYGLKGWESTLGALHELDIKTVGHPKNWFEHDVLEWTVNDIRLGFIGITDVLKPFPVDWEEAKKQIAVLDERNDFTIVMIHWGLEYQTSSSLRQQTKAHGLVDAGADLIIGHHPHVVQESEVYEGVSIYYSLGNFIFDQYFSEAVQEGLGLDITLRSNGEILIEEIPFHIEKGQARLD